MVGYGAEELSYWREMERWASMLFGAAWGWALYTAVIIMWLLWR